MTVNLRLQFSLFQNIVIVAFVLPTWCIATTAMMRAIARVTLQLGIELVGLR
jgi:hypothetical protein